MRNRARPFALLLLAASATARAQVPAGANFRVSSYTTNSQSNPAVAADAQGNFVVVWQDTNNRGSYGQRFSASGAPQGGEFRVESATLRYPAVSRRAEGDFVVAWEGPVTAMVRRFTAAAEPMGSESIVPGVRVFPRVAVAAEGGFMVIGSNLVGYDIRVYGAAFAGDGSLRAQFRVGDGALGVPRQADVAALPDGFVVVWSNPSDGSQSGILAQRYDAGGIPRGGNFLVNTNTLFGQRYPSVASSAAGAFVVVWESITGEDSGGIVGQRFDAAGQRLGAEFHVNAYTTFLQQHPSVASDAAGNFVVTWDGFGDNEGSNGQAGTFARRFRADGVPRGGDFAVNTYTTGSQRLPRVASDDSGNVTIAWWDYDVGRNASALAQRFGGLVSNGMAVDTAGNGVFEPGEAVDVVTSWHNVSSAAQTIAGTAVSFTGPLPATYELKTASASYPTIPDGETRACLDCYRVAVPTTARPLLHWDAVLDEGLTPDTQGQEKLWRIHLGASFADVPASSPFYRFVETLLHREVTGGCGAATYCPGASATREEMSVFVLVAKEGAGFRPPPCSAPMFTDVPAGSPFCPFIEELARRGVVGGCGGGKYCPGAPVSREQMPVFVLRTLDPGLDPPACATPAFADVPASSPFCRWIEELARRGVVVGCGGGNYCPADPVTREQMSVFISSTFALTLYGP